MSMMSMLSSQVDELRRMLDELRKLACDINEEEINSHSVITLNQGRYNRQFRLDMNHDWLNAWHAEFERILQAIAATLGTGTCEVEESWHGESEMVEYRCTACDEYMAVEVVKPDGAQPPNYCPNCGAKVVEPTTNDVDAEVNGG